MHRAGRTRGLSFQERFLSLGDRVERTLVRLVIGLALLVFLAQAALARPDLRRWLSFVDRLEGVSLATYSTGLAGPPAAAVPSTALGLKAVPGSSLTLSLVGRKGASWATVLVNGDAAGSLATGSLTCAVRAGDLVEIDPGQRGVALTVKVTGSRGISYPTVGQVITAQNTIARLGRVLAAAGP